MGLDYLVFDNRSGALGSCDSSRRAAWCERRYGVGGHGMIFLESSVNADIGVRVFGRDGHPTQFNSLSLAVAYAAAADWGWAGRTIDDTLSVSEGELISQHGLLSFISLRLSKTFELGRSGNSYRIQTPTEHRLIAIDDLDHSNVGDQVGLLQSRYRLGSDSSVCFFEPCLGAYHLRSFLCADRSEEFANGLAACALAFMVGSTNALKVRSRGGELQVQAQNKKTVQMQTLVTKIYQGELS